MKLIPKRRKRRKKRKKRKKSFQKGRLSLRTSTPKEVGWLSKDIFRSLKKLKEMTSTTLLRRWGKVQVMKEMV